MPPRIGQAIRPQELFELTPAPARVRSQPERDETGPAGRRRARREASGPSACSSKPAHPHSEHAPRSVLANGRAVPWDARPGPQTPPRRSSYRSGHGRRRTPNRTWISRSGWRPPTGARLRCTLPLRCLLDSAAVTGPPPTRPPTTRRPEDAAWNISTPPREVVDRSGSPVARLLLPAQIEQYQLAPFLASCP